MNIKRLSADTLMARILAWLAGALYRYRWWWVLPQLALFALCVLYTFKYLEFDVNRSNLVGPNKKYHQNFLKFKKEFPTQDDLVVVVESEDPEKNRQFVERLGVRLEAETNLFKDVFYKGDLKLLGAKALLFVPDADLVELKNQLEEYKPFIERFSQTTNLLSLFSMVNTQFRTAERERNAQNEAMINALPALRRIVVQGAASLRRLGTPPSPGINALFDPTGEAEQQVYITFGGGRLYLVSAQAPTDELNGAAVERLRQLVAETQTEVPGVNVGLTGEPVLEHDEMAQSQKDTTVASIASLVLCALIFIYGYQQVGRPIKATFCLIIGLGYTMGFTTLVIGHLNILTITFVPILIGLAIDYGVHLISRYEEELRHGRTEREAMAKAIIYTGQGIFTGAFTTAGAFLAMSFTDFKGIQEMGIICGGGLLICLIPMLTMLPVMLYGDRRNRLDHDQGDADLRRARIENLWLQRPWAVAGVTVTLCALAGTQIHKVHFDYDLLHMQSAGLPAVEYEKKLIRFADKSVLFAAVVADTRKEADELEARITQLPSVASVDSISKFLGGDQTRKLALVGEIKSTLANISFGPPDRAPVDIPELSRTLWSLAGYLGLAAEASQNEEPKIAAELGSLRASVVDFRREMLREPRPGAEPRAVKLAAYQQALFEDVRDTFNALKHQDDRAPLRISDLPAALRHRFVGVSGKYLLMVYPRKDVWQRENQREFIQELQSVYPNVTGTPVQLYYYTELLKRSYEEAARYSLVAIVILVLFHFRSAVSVALALVPVGVGFLWLGGIMGALHIPLNPANIMTLPLVIGIGVTNGIHILNRYAEEQTPSILARSTGKAVLISGLTTIAGFGSLTLAKHQGIQSLGYVMSIGLATCMLAGLTFLPALLVLLMQRAGPGRGRKQPSADNARSTPGREEPR